MLVESAQETGALNLGLCINLGGKLRMLSHRYCLFLSQGRGHEPQAAVTLRSFEMTLGALLTESARVAPPGSPAGRALGTGYERVRALVDLFLVRARTLADPGLEAGSSAVTELTDLTTGPLLDGLNRLVEGFQQDMETRERRREAEVVDALDQLDDLSSRVKLLSINARIVSARAGAVGRVYNVINQELQALAEESHAASGRLRTIQARAEGNG